jgi:hypothetical protein
VKLRGYRLLGDPDLHTKKRLISLLETACTAIDTYQTQHECVFIISYLLVFYPGTVGTENKNMIVPYLLSQVSNQHENVSSTIFTKDMNVMYMHKHKSCG